jgi:hypothetical protein
LPLDLLDQRVTAWIGEQRTTVARGKRAN